jgi:hypothetical protein
MHNSFFEFACDELKMLDDKARQGAAKSSDVAYADALEHYRKSKLTADAMEDSGYSGDGWGYSGAGRGYAPRDERGRFSGASYADRNLADELRHRASMERDERARREMHSMADRIERGA